jgi:hypothetical protein
VADAKTEVPDRVKCPYCGEDLDLGYAGLEVYRDARTGEQEAAFVPCCQHLADDLMWFGFDGIFGFSLIDFIRAHTGLDPLRVDDWDGRLIYRLRGHAPGAGVKGWRKFVFDFIREHHRHHRNPPAGWKFGVAVYNGDVLVGVAVVGRPVSRVIQQREPGTLEVTRCCTAGDHRLRRHAASKLYGLAAREAKKLGATKLITYTLETEEGVSLRAAGWTPVARTKGGSWNTPARPRTDKAPTCKKIRWEKEV